MAQQEDYELFEAVRDNDHVRLQEILTLRSDEQVRNAKQGESSPLHLAVGSVDCVRLLLKKGVSATETDKDGFTPFHLAAQGDYSESLRQLFLHGCDINRKTEPPDAAGSSATQNKGGKTALEIALERGSVNSINILLFCGAQQTDLLDEEQRKYQDAICHGYKEKKIHCGGMTARARVWAELNATLTGDADKIGISVRSHSEDFDFFCRRLPVDFESSSIHVERVEHKDGETLITDIYQYRVNRDVTCDVSMPIVIPEGERPTRYQGFIVRQSYHGDADSSETIRVEGNTVHIENLRLFAHGHQPMVGLGVFLKNRVQKLDLDPTRENTFTSEVEREFQVTTPPGEGSLEMEVMEAEKEQPEGSRENYNHTDFCNIRGTTTAENTEDTNNDDDDDDTTGNLHIKLPTPDMRGDERPVAMTCPEGSSGIEADSWNERTDAQVDSKHRVVNIEKGKKGSYIVVGIVGRVTSWLKYFVRNLYERATSNKVECVLFAAIKRIETGFIVNITLSNVDQRKEEETKWEKYGYFVKPDMSREITIHKKKQYTLKLICYEGTCKSVDWLPLHYQGSLSKQSEFKVKADSVPDGKVLVFKGDLPKDHGENSKKVKWSILFYYLEQNARNSIPPDRFPSDAFLYSLGEQFGPEWIDIGIQLKNTNPWINDMRPVAHKDRNKRILDRWRMEFFKDPHGALDTLFTAFVKAERIDLAKKTQKEISRISSKDNTHYLKEWLNKYAEGNTNGPVTERKYSFRRLESIPESPIDEKPEPFLLSAAKHLPPDFSVFYEMGMKDEQVDEIRFQTDYGRNWQKFQLLMKFKTSQHCEDSSFKLLKKLLTGLINIKANLACEEIKNKIKDWLDSEEGNAIEIRIRNKVEKIIR